MSLKIGTHISDSDIEVLLSPSILVSVVYTALAAVLDVSVMTIAVRIPTATSLIFRINSPTTFHTIIYTIKLKRYKLLIPCHLNVSLLT